MTSAFTPGQSGLLDTSIYGDVEHDGQKSTSSPMTSIEVLKNVARQQSEENSSCASFDALTDVDKVSPSDFISSKQF